MLEENFFLQVCDSESVRRWDKVAIKDAARHRVPDVILGSHREIMLADINRQWAGWFVESFGDPRRYIRHNARYPEIYEDVKAEVGKRFSNWAVPDRGELVQTIARRIYDLVRADIEKKKRTQEGTEDKRLLLDLSGDPPRCWICGHEFGAKAVDAFLLGERFEERCPPFVDLLKPSGLVASDSRIEIDHIEAFHEGGGTPGNLALACGFCNRYKGGFSSIYDVSGRPSEARASSSTIFSVPQPFWVIRFLATIGRCESRDGCHATNRNAELTVCPVSLGGALNPSNLRVTCYEHDPLWECRFVPRKEAMELWGKIVRE